ncbi:tRNA-2-methylthio-N6-dimethylallyladenosine synthase [Candidatus Planktophila versatilis]|uniref:tRNA-2-methylthio-N(6)-dimethylallyladenosine synthase n=1 Tax=Candidatus Planktophila versatilis TaxID=1884905 RepID=A0AAC9YVW5_9ACTN|nr:tRNA (N6-isopentenyl adenosine(37)-C2)-methylthiotransferase MiaB [Candidatus Planktophila versatilis]ASY18704.1 tRNA-2-methylthio-N6-dimethylallyladenosine synthase [Candidatus Planktophila versatilis]ASY22723.1 tRNA-2-methylthio-N6-dimethylallyladenosine synthase [Candidatus Planktophila versatilis]
MSRTYLVETYGCQMNVHDSERIAGLLDEAGHIPVIPGEQADIVVFNTCAVRENADNKLYGNLSFLAPIKKKNPAMQIAVGGCLAQKDQSIILKKAPYVDVVFGTHNVGSLPLLLERARIEEESQIEILESLEHFPSTLPARRFSAFTSWVSISVGCNNTCTFCIVPALRGIEKDRAAADVLKEMQMLVDQGVIEITLLGQNVNAYGVEFGDRGAFAKLLRDAGKIQGLERVRFMSPHPRDFTDDVIEAMAQTKNVMPHLHMPLQSGSDSILQSMRRSYRTDKYLGILERVRASIPQAMITTDIIVGFPGESETDFQGTLDITTQARFAAAYTYKYSIRPGTPAGVMPNQVPQEIVGERYTRLHEHQQKISLSVNEESIGSTHRVMVSEVEGRRDESRSRMTGKSEDFRLVHFDADTDARPGDFVDVHITEASAHYLIGSAVSVMRTRGGDAHAAKSAPASTSLGIPKVRTS